MSFPLFETIAIIKGEAQNLFFHQQRYERSLAIYYDSYQVIDLEQIITQALPKDCAELMRCRIDYNQQDYQIQFFPYQRKHYRRFQPVICDDIDYSLKYTDRTLLNQLLAQKGDCDEIIIIKQGKVTDCSIGNLIFRQGNQWFTPDSPLLAGTQRAKLLQQGKIKERSIFAEDLPLFDEVRLINGMNGLDETIA